MPEFTNSDFVDADHEKMLFELRRRIPDRFVITHYDASMFIDELMEAAISLRLNLIEFEHVLVAFGTDDPAKVEAYKSIMNGWGWQIFDSEDGSFREADEGGQ